MTEDYDMPARDAARFGLPGWRFYTHSFDYGERLGVAIERGGPNEPKQRAAVSYKPSKPLSLTQAFDSLKQWAAEQ